MKRLAFPLLIAFALNVALFVVMQAMVVQKRIRLADVSDFQLANFIRVPEASKPPPSRREAPSKPSAEAHQAETTSLAQNNQQGSSLNVPASFEFGFDAGGVGAPKIYMDSLLTAIIRTPPVYPSRAAARGVEGYVDILYTITKTGLVEDPVVLEAQPEGMFEKAAMRAIVRWKYSPMLENGKPIAVKAKARVIFRLAQGNG